VSLILLRHASAGDREKWDADDRLRPLDKRGRKQAKKLCEILLGYDLTRAVSSPYVRCVETIERLGLEIVRDERLAEGAPLTETLSLLGEADGAVVCTHGDVIVNVLGRDLKKGAAVVLDGLEVVDELPAP
jgi:8-oxo-dGTP diphosphatase